MSTNTNCWAFVRWTSSWFFVHMSTMVTRLQINMFEILSDLNQAAPNHLTDDSQTRQLEKPPDHPSLRKVRWCIWLTRLTLVCDVIWYSLVWQHLERLFGLQPPFSLSSCIFFVLIVSPSYFLSCKSLSKTCWVDVRPFLNCLHMQNYINIISNTVPSSSALDKETEDKISHVDGNSSASSSLSVFEGKQEVAPPKKSGILSNFFEARLALAPCLPLQRPTSASGKLEGQTPE